VPGSQLSTAEAACVPALLGREHGAGRGGHPDSTAAGSDPSALLAVAQALVSPCRLFAERQQLNYRLHSVSCTGTEVHISMCTFQFYRGNSSAACSTGMPAVVSCLPGPLFATGSAQKKKQRQQQQSQGSLGWVLRWSTAAAALRRALSPSPLSWLRVRVQGTHRAGGGDGVLSLNVTQSRQLPLCCAKCAVPCCAAPCAALCCTVPCCTAPCCTVPCHVVP